MSKAHDLLLDIATEKNGYSIGKPWRFSEFSLAAVVPIVRVVDEVRSYRLAAEVGKELSVQDTGSIQKMQFFNKSAYPVLLKSGEVVTGATQSRTILTSQIIMSQEKVVVDCACVHQTKGIRQGQRVELEAYSPIEVRRVVRSRYSQPKYDYTSELQQNVWNSVRSFSKSADNKVRHLASFAANNEAFNYLTTSHTGRTEQSRIDSQTYFTPQEDLAGRVEENSEKLEEILKQVPKTENQVGICLITLNGLESLESFNHPEAWEAIRKSILKSDSGKVADVSDESVFEYREDKAKSFIRALLTTNYDEKTVIEGNDYSTVALVDKKLVGEVVMLYGKPIHCSFVSKN